MSISLSTNSARECRLERRKSAKPRRSIRREIRTVALATSTTSIQTVAPFLAAPSPSLRRGFWSKHRVNSQRKEQARRSGHAREVGARVAGLADANETLVSSKIGRAHV